MKGTLTKLIFSRLEDELIYVGMWPVTMSLSLLSKCRFKFYVRVCQTPAMGIVCLNEEYAAYAKNGCLLFVSKNNTFSIV